MNRRDGGKRQQCQARRASGSTSARSAGRAGRADVELLALRYQRPGRASSYGAPVPDDPMNSFFPSENVMSRPFARRVPSFA